MGLMDRTVWALAGAIRTWVGDRWHRAEARAAPNLEDYVADLEAAGADVTGTRDEDSGPQIYVEFAGRWVDLKQRVELEYRLIDEQPSAGPTLIALRPGPG